MFQFIKLSARFFLLSSVSRAVCGGTHAPLIEQQHLQLHCQPFWWVLLVLFLTPRASCVHYPSSHDHSFFVGPIHHPPCCCIYPFTLTLLCLKFLWSSSSSPLVATSPCLQLWWVWACWAVCLSHVSEAEPTAGSAKGGPYLRSLTLYHMLENPLASSQHLLNLSQCQILTLLISL